jgi:predicted dehydrogenase
LSLDIGLVGVGPWGAHILRDLRSLGATVHAAARFPESIARARDGGAASIVDDPGKLPSCAGYVIANRTSQHLDAIETLLPRGRPIFTEKPISPDVDRTKRLPASAFGLVFVMHKWRYHPGVLELARIASSGEYGPVLGLRTMRLGFGNPHADAGSLWILAPHDLSIALEILGETPQLVSAAIDPMDATGAIAHLRTHDGTPITMEVSSGHPHPNRSILLHCRDAIFTLNSTNYEVIDACRIDDGARSAIMVPGTMPLLAELRAFLEHLEGGPPPVTSLAEEIKIIEVIASIEKSTTRA